MNIQQAIESGRPFKRRIWQTYIPFAQEVLARKDGGRVIYLTKRDVLANDWEIEIPRKPRCCPCGCQCTCHKAITSTPLVMDEDEES